MKKVAIQTSFSSYSEAYSLNRVVMNQIRGVCLDCKTPIGRRAKRCRSCYYLWRKGKRFSFKTEFKKGNTPWHKGKKTGLIPKTVFKKGQFVREKHPQWKGRDVKYRSLHSWIVSNLGQPETCEFCGKSGLSGHHIDWANRSGNYTRDFNDWLRLCRSCHMKYDGTAYKIWESREASL
jgi:hypothetical protein